MGDGRQDLASVLCALGLPMPRTMPRDLGSLGRTHVYVLEEVVVKCDDRFGTASMLREKSALDLLANTDLPVAAVLANGTFDDGRAWIVLERLPGVRPEDASLPAHELSVELASQLGAIVARLHDVETPGFGSWARDPQRSFAEEERARMEALTRMAYDAKIVERSEIESLTALMGTTIEAVFDRDRPVLAHRDVQPRNVLVDGGRVCALLDFESSGGGDPAEDFRTVGLDWSTSAFAAMTQAYKAAGGSLGADGPDRVAHYVLDWALVVLAYLGRIAPSYLPAARTAIERVRDGERPSV